ncbi:CYTH domain-containing protein [Fluviicola sp.]|jgi:CYTH domain-containing protein|uniref:CYTH domain-containing protein n=1 Tax=Fluviicola sp. TaxID=1917219 RepID=UPI002819DD21|nr:CYTH domain-containing protein [Fluviicola sp.]MDR0802738.1 CYTH domain-containing protein [Fluviicola sp.]
MKEIERKFLVKDELLDVVKYLQSKKIRQGYISDLDGKTVRVRTKGDKGYLTIKGKNSGISRDEFEYEIPFEDAGQLLLNFCSKVLEKERFDLIVGEKKWEIDIFHGKLEGLIIAELELGSEEEAFEVPSWVREEVSGDVQYYNSNLIQKA